MSEIEKNILMNQLRIMTALQRLDYGSNTTAIVDDLGRGIKETQQLLSEDLDKKYVKNNV